jgi:hypothetical protein
MEKLVAKITGSKVVAGMFFRQKGILADVRKVVMVQDRRAYYVCLSHDASFIHTGSCSTSHLCQWGDNITAEEANALIPDIETKINNWSEKKQAEKEESLEESRSLALMTASDEEIIAEVKRRKIPLDRLAD